MSQRESNEAIKESLLDNLTQILFFPSWRKLIDSNFNGFYLNMPVHNVIKDNVVLLPDLILTGQEETT